MSEKSKAAASMLVMLRPGDWVRLTVPITSSLHEGALPAGAYGMVLLVDRMFFAHITVQFVEHGQWILSPKHKADLEVLDPVTVQRLSAQTKTP